MGQRADPKAASSYREASLTGRRVYIAAVSCKLPPGLEILIGPLIFPPVYSPGPPSHSSSQLLRASASSKSQTALRNLLPLNARFRLLLIVRCSEAAPHQKMRTLWCACSKICYFSMVADSENVGVQSKLELDLQVPCNEASQTNNSQHFR